MEEQEKERAPNALEYLIVIVAVLVSVVAGLIGANKINPNDEKKGEQ